MVWSAGRLIMPTDLNTAVSARKREAKAQLQTETTVLSVFVIICLAMLLLLVVNQSFSKVAIELLGQF
jgi:hypothetical protein